jgi:micrococcal nuclease
MLGTTLAVAVEKAVDGDTVRVIINGQSESIRILALDTEESKAGGDKPVTPWGKEAAKHAASVFQPGKMITLEFEGSDPLEVCLKNYRDDFGRLLAFVHVDAMDYQEHMILEGFSPYFTKYGNARFDLYHHRYVAAECAAQAARRGLWDQVTVNGSEQRNYALLGAWWSLRAAVIEDYRRARRAGMNILNSRLDFAAISAKARQGESAVIFTELREYVRLGSRKAVVEIGSKAQPFKIFIPDVESAGGEGLLNLLSERYIASGSDGRTVTRPRRSYAYVSGPLKLFRDEPEIVLTDPSGVADSPELALSGS